MDRYHEASRHEDRWSTLTLTLAERGDGGGDECGTIGRSMMVWTEEKSAGNDVDDHNRCWTFPVYDFLGKVDPFREDDLFGEVDPFRDERDESPLIGVSGCGRFGHSRIRYSIGGREHRRRLAFRENGSSTSRLRAFDSSSCGHGDWRI